MLENVKMNSKKTTIFVLDGVRLTTKIMIQCQ